jgi:hypothetical protein
VFTGILVLCQPRVQAMLIHVAYFVAVEGEPSLLLGELTQSNMQSLAGYLHGARL